MEEQMARRLVAEEGKKAAAGGTGGENLGQYQLPYRRESFCHHAERAGL